MQIDQNKEMKRSTKQLQNRKELTVFHFAGGAPASCDPWRSDPPCSSCASAVRPRPVTSAEKMHQSHCSYLYLRYSQSEMENSAVVLSDVDETWSNCIWVEAAFCWSYLQSGEVLLEGHALHDRWTSEEEQEELKSTSLSLLSPEGQHQSHSITSTSTHTRWCRQVVCSSYTVMECWTAADIQWFSERSSDNAVKWCSDAV